MQSNLFELFNQYANVVAWINGHTHNHRIFHHPGKNPKYDFWEITTASLIDIPQQARTIELFNNNDGTLSVFCSGY